MSIDNTVTITGNVTDEPKLSFTPSGKPVASFTVAQNRKWDGGEATTFVRVTAWGSLGENVASCIPKGARVIVVGRLDQNEFETTEGDKRSYIFITAEGVGPDLRFAEVDGITKSSGGGKPKSEDDDFDPFEEED